MPTSLKTLESFSTALLTLDELPPTASPARLMSDGMAALRALVPFDAAWWGECSGGMDGLAPRNWLSGRLNLGADFAREWNRIGAVDRFAAASMQQLDAAVWSSGYADPEPAVEAFATRHDLFHALAITRALPGSGLMHFIALYRGQQAPAFEAAQRRLFELFSAHLMQRWSRRVTALLGQARAGADAHALVDAAGEFVYLDARLGLWLRERFPAWQGTQLPAELTTGLGAGATSLRVGRRRLSLQRCGELWLLGLAPQRRAPVLPPRELGVALLYAHGHTHKQIARELGLSPSTVRTYLRDAYQRLGVSTKAALARRLEGQALPAIKP
ncbi:helix-turn-helix transcriptional regulator [Ideonella alba]|uniref:Response regulator transcription factor n=1 Tax=Ideonella alba TaxID=2824118 RepID=A0A940YBJ5_9BURK|nr:LuxR C-terminal-related transcriptional regulator [Ideonella alba]MBQ0931163.1 response regulator transcription factor [Ideonella alba]